LHLSGLGDFSGAAVAQGEGAWPGDGTDGKMWIHNDRYEYFLETNGLNIIDMDK
jgi:hypothetical protein